MEASLLLQHPQCRGRYRLGICQKIYMTQFSGERILHTENAYIETIFANNKQQKYIIISNLALFWLKWNKMCKFFNSYEEFPSEFALFPQNFTQLGKILQDRRSRQISSLHQPHQFQASSTSSRAI